MLHVSKIFVAVVCSGGIIGGSAIAQSTKSVPSTLAPFVPAYQRYVAGYIERKGEKGLRAIVTPDFIWYTGEKHTPLRGNAAIVQAAKELGFSEPNLSNDSVKYSRSLAVQSTVPQISDKNADASTYVLLNYGTIVMEANTGKGAAAIGLYKQTWKKTAQGWKLASMELDTRPDAQAHTGSYIPVAQGDEAKLFPVK